MQELTQTEIAIHGRAGGHAVDTYALTGLGDARVTTARQEGFFSPGTAFWPNNAIIRESSCRLPSGSTVRTLSIEHDCDYEAERGTPPYDAPDWSYHCAMWVGVEAEIPVGSRCDVPLYAGGLTLDAEYVGINGTGVVCAGWYEHQQSADTSLCQVMPTGGGTSEPRCIAPVQ